MGVGLQEVLSQIVTGNPALSGNAKSLDVVVPFRGLTFTMGTSSLSLGYALKIWLVDGGVLVF